MSQLLDNLVVQQQKLDKEVSKCHKQREQEQNKFVKELQSSKTKI